MRTKQRENAIIITLVFAIMFCMGMGYSYVTKQLSPTGKTYQVLFNNIEAKIPDNSIATADSSVFQNQPTANLSLTLNRPGDSLVYQVQVVNNGDRDAMVKDINIVDVTTDGEVAPITYTVEGISKGAIIKSGSVATFTITVIYENDSTAQENPVSKDIQVSLNCEGA